VSPDGTAVVITTHQRLERLGPLLDRVLDDPGSTEVVVVADGCGDGTDDYLLSRAAREPRLRPLLLHPNVGQPRARAAGVRAASYELVLSLDDDVMPDPGLASRHAMRHRCGDVDVVLGYMPTYVPKPRRRGQFATNEYAEEYERTALQWEDSPDDVLPYFWGGNFSVRRDRFLAAVDGYDFPLRYHEDADLGLRLRELGCRAVFDRGLRAVHEHSRGWHAYLEEARSAGAGRVLLARSWPHDRPYDALELLALATPPVRMVALLCRKEPWHSVTMALLKAAVTVAGPLGWWSVEDKTSRLAKLLEGHRAVRRATAALSPG